jgi:translation initiation factor 2-alpha kinase 4
VDLATSGSSAYPDTLTVPAPSKDTSAPEVQLILPVDTKKQKKHVKQLLLDRGNADSRYDSKSTNIFLAYERAGHLKTAVQNGLPMLAVDVPNAVFDTLMKNASWITDEETWKGITASMPTVYMAYAQQIREAAAKRKAEGFPYLLLYATREERMQILTLN